jgi:hypothetical protein
MVDVAEAGAVKEIGKVTVGFVDGRAVRRIGLHNPLLTAIP